MAFVERSNVLDSASGVRILIYIEGEGKDKWPWQNKHGAITKSWSLVVNRMNDSIHTSFKVPAIMAFVQKVREAAIGHAGIHSSNGLGPCLLIFIYVFSFTYMFPTRASFELTSFSRGYFFRG
jgi:hypothetical protein